MKIGKSFWETRYGRKHRKHTMHSSTRIHSTMSLMPIAHCIYIEIIEISPLSILSIMYNGGTGMWIYMLNSKLWKFPECLSISKQENGFVRCAHGISSLHFLPYTFDFYLAHHRHRQPHPTFFLSAFQHSAIPSPRDTVSVRYRLFVVFWFCCARHCCYFSGLSFVFCHSCQNASILFPFHTE